MSLSGLAARTPLRLKLVATVVALAAAGLSASAAATTATLHSYLLGRVDDQLRMAAHGIADGVRFGPGIGGGRPAAPPPLAPKPAGAAGGRLPSPYYVRVYSADGRPTGSADAAPLTAQSPPDLPSLQPYEGAVRAGRAFTVPAVGGHEDWRVLALPAPGGDTTVVIATSLSDVSHTLNHLVVAEMLIGLAALGLMAAAGYALIRRSLSPLVAVEHTAQAIAAGDLSRRVPSLHPRTEVGRLAAALNAMLGHIEHAFARQRASELQARESEARMRRFAADASHELRTPLTSIRGFAELHRIAGSADAHVSLSMARIEEEAERMALLIDDLLLLARLDQQRPLEAVPVDLLAVAQDVVTSARRTAPARRIDLAVDATVPPIVTGDQTRLRQVVDNLMRNALIHTPPEAAVRVRVAVDEPAHGAVIEVADDGPGMSDEDAARIFERFYRADPARSRQVGGSGLGLSIVASLVAAHGGTVSVLTRPGDGATFRVELPLTTV